jgi:hypothetical protein
MAAVNSGIKPTAPHQLLKYIPTEIIATPSTILIILSTFPTLHFMPVTSTKKIKHIPED